MKKTINLILALLLAVTLNAQTYGGNTDLLITGASAQTATVNNILNPTSGASATNVVGFRSATVQVVITGSGGTYVFEGSNDNVNFAPIVIYNTTLTSGAFSNNIIGASPSQIVYSFPVITNYIRLRIATTITGGTIQAFTKLMRTTFALAIRPVVQSTAANFNVTVGSSVLPSGFLTPSVAAHATSNPNTTGVRAFQLLQNGSTWDLQQNNIEATLLASASRTTTQTGADIVNYNGKKLVVVLDVTSAGTGSVTISIQRKDLASGKYIDILVGTAVTTASTNVYRIGQDIPSVANQTALDYLSRVFRIVVTANNANAMTYSVGYNLGL